MELTLLLDDDLWQVLNERAKRENVPVSTLVNQILRREVSAGTPGIKPPPFRQQTYAMGTARFNVDKANSFLDDLELEEYLRKRAEGK